MRILIAEVVHEAHGVLRAHLETLKWQADNADADVDMRFLVDPTAPPNTGKLIHEELAAEYSHSVEVASEKPSDSHYHVDEQTTEWSKPTFYWLGRQRQRLLDHARAEDYDAVFMVDSDLLLSPDTLQSLIDAEQPITAGVFWTRWQKDSPPLPQVWLNQPYELEGRGWRGHEFLQALSNRQLTEVYGLGACTLIRLDDLPEGVRYAPRLQGLPDEGLWQGEDRSFCMRAEQHRVPMYADPWPDIFHVYRPTDREGIGDWLKALEQRPKIAPDFGDLVSLRLEPLEAPRLEGYVCHLRGRLGGIDMLQQLEDEIAEMAVGDEKLLQLQFPPWYDVPEYRGKRKTIRAELLGAKTYAPHPNTQAVDLWSRFKNFSKQRKNLTQKKEVVEV